MSTDTEHAKERLDALAVIERLGGGHMGDTVVRDGIVAIQRLIDRDVLRDRERPPAGAEDPGVPFCIERKAHGVTEHLTFLEWARMVIGDEYAATRVAHVMLTADDTSKGYPCVHKGASEEREEYVVLDPDALRAQMHDWATLREQT